MEKKDFGKVLYEKEGSIARCILNWPERANVQTSEMVWALDEALKEAKDDREVKVCILKANGNGFCAGHEAKGLPGAYPEFDEDSKAYGVIHQGQQDVFVRPMEALWDFPKPMIAQVHGYAVGGGTYWACLPDITIASEETIFQMPLVQSFGLPGGETMIEPWVFMNFKRAAEYMYTTRTLSAEEALEWGMINRVVPRDKLEETVEDMAAHIAQAPGSTLQMTKALIRRAWDLMGIKNHWQMSNDLISLGSKATDSGELRKYMFEQQMKPRDLAAQKEAEAREARK